MNPSDTATTKKKWTFDSTVIHADAAYPAGGAPVAPALTVSTTFHQHLPQDLVQAFKDLGLGSAGDGGHGQESPKYIYSRSSNPALTRVETIIGAAEGAYNGSPGPAHAVCYASGLAALNGALHYFKPKRVYSWAGYHGSLQAIRDFFELTDNRTSANNNGNPIAIQSVSELPKTAELTATDLILVEYPTNPYGQLPDLAVLRQAAGPHAIIVVDATLAPPPLHFTLQTSGAAIDLVMHSGTKYYGGHSDLLSGILVTRDASVASRLRFKRTSAGSVPGNMELWLLARSLRTLAIRVKHQSATAGQLVEWLTQVQSGHVPGLRGLVTKVWSAKLPSGSYSPLLSVELKSRTAAQALPYLLQLAKPATSLGGVETLVEWRAQHDTLIEPTLVRISVGLEDASDLIEDWRRALVLAEKVSESVGVAP